MSDNEFRNKAQTGYEEVLTADDYSRLSKKNCSIKPLTTVARPLMALYGLLCHFTHMHMFNLYMYTYSPQH